MVGCLGSGCLVMVYWSFGVECLVHNNQIAILSAEST